MTWWYFRSGIPWASLTGFFILDTNFDYKLASLYGKIVKRGNVEKNLICSCVDVGSLNLPHWWDKDEMGEKIEDEFFFSSERTSRWKTTNWSLHHSASETFSFFTCLIRMGVESDSNSEFQEEEWSGRVPDSRVMGTSDPKAGKWKVSFTLASFLTLPGICF